MRETGSAIHLDQGYWGIMDNHVINVEKFFTWWPVRTDCGWRWMTVVWKIEFTTVTYKRQIDFETRYVAEIGNRLRISRQHENWLVTIG